MNKENSEFRIPNSGFLRTVAALVALVVLAGASYVRGAEDWIAALGGRVLLGPGGEVDAIELRGTWVTDADLARIAAFPRLRRLDLALTRISDQGMLRLKDARTIRELDLSYAELITDEGMAAVRGWPLERLSVRGTKITDTTLALVGGIRSLQALDAGFAQITDTGIEHLAPLASLRELALGGNKLTERAIQVLSAFPELRRLDLSGRQRTDSGLWSVSVTDLGIEPVTRLRELRELRLGGTQVTGRALEKLAVLTKLEKLDLHGARRIGEDAVAALGALGGLRWVDLKDSGVPQAAVEKLRAARAGVTVLWE